jgi:hypothetical protein
VLSSLEVSPVFHFHFYFHWLTWVGWGYALLYFGGPFHFVSLPSVVPLGGYVGHDIGLMFVLQEYDSGNKVMYLDNYYGFKILFSCLM